MLYRPEDIENEKMLTGIFTCSSSVICRLQTKALVDLSNPRETEVEFSILQFPNHEDRNIIMAHKLPKRRKVNEYRMVYSVYGETFANALKSFKFYLNDLYIPHRSVHGFIANRNIVTNSREHIDKRQIINIDIKNFFESITDVMIKELFVKYGFCDAIAIILSKIVTLEGRLVAGFATSPVVANMYCNDMDIAIDDLCVKNNITYTRYADDITLSGDHINVLEDVQSILAKYGFEVNNSKTRRYRKGQGLYVTGLSVEDANMPRIPKYLKKRLYEKIFFVSKYGLKSTIAYKRSKRMKYDYVDSELKIYLDADVEDMCACSLAAKILGWLSFAQSIEPIFADKCRALLSTLTNKRDIEMFEDARNYIHNTLVDK